MLESVFTQRFLKKWKPELPYDPAISYLGINPQELKSGSQRDACTSCSLQHCSQSARHGSNLNPSTQKGIKKMWYIHTMEYYSVFKKQEILPLMTTWHKPGGYYAKWNKTQKDKNYMIPLIWKIKNSQTHRSRE